MGKHDVRLVTNVSGAQPPRETYSSRAKLEDELHSCTAFLATHPDSGGDDWGGDSGRHRLHGRRITVFGEVQIKVDPTLPPDVIRVQGGAGWTEVKIARDEHGRSVDFRPSGA